MGNRAARLKSSKSSPTGHKPQRKCRQLTIAVDYAANASENKQFDFSISDILSGCEVLTSNTTCPRMTNKSNALTVTSSNQQQRISHESVRKADKRSSNKYLDGLVDIYVDNTEETMTHIQSTDSLASYVQDEEQDAYIIDNTITYLKARMSKGVEESKGKDLHKSLNNNRHLKVPKSHRLSYNI
ncbi:hypothetical protein ABK040_006061 [Willaertia magna]